MNEEYLKHLIEMRNTLARRLRILELKQAAEGSSTPPHIIMEIEDITKKIKELDEEIAGQVGALRVGVAQNVVVILEGRRWTLEGGDVQLSKTDAEENHAYIKQEVGNYASIGAQLLNELLQNYRRHQHLTAAENDLEVPNLKCFNQFLVRQKLSYPERSTPIIELTGPSGIGKSHILCAICAGSPEEREVLGIVTDEWSGWKTVYVDACNERLSFDQIMREFAGSLAKMIGDSAGVRRPLPQILMQAVRAGFNHFLFVLDSADSIDLSDLARLTGDEGPAGRSIRNSIPLAPGLVLRLVVASRRPRVSQALLTLPESHTISGVFSLQMDPLDQRSVREMLVDRLEVKGFPSDRTEGIDKLAAAIYQISGGHPRAISTILNRLEDELFAVQPDEVVKRFQSIVLHIVQNDIIGDLCVEEYLLLNVLSIFRRGGIRLIMRLYEIGLLPENVLAKSESKDYISWANWLENLRETTTYIRSITDDASSEFTVHPVLRHVLPMDLHAMAPDQLQALHSIAFKLYDEDLRSYDPSGIRRAMHLDRRPLYMMEALYHYVQSQLIAGKSDPAIAQKITDLSLAYMEIYREVDAEEHGGFDPAPFALRKRWKHDSELHSCIAMLVDGDNALKAIEQLFK